ncbi:hypothetical protein ACFFMR_17715 [Micromonospora andamanensis]|uniref:Transmembrane protein (PGPGW) n=1 Tax=Micromonospora andamanensis TaxID=1287068 RepID=A0ABQ4I0V1_9ACTN|nr:hypothetical protein [Micromonospora andamanensis]GIJ11507.1 hypothetical protein Van01_47210 [Micromonospora andamanensis]
MSISPADRVLLSRARRKLVVFGGLSLVALPVGLPGWSVVALLLISVAIPVAVGLTGGGSLLRELLRPRPGADAERWRARSTDSGTRRPRASA